MGGVYQILALHSREFIIGSTYNTNKRWNEHLSELRANKHQNQRLQNIYNKHGEANLWFGVLEIVENRADLLVREQAWIDQFWEAGCLLNLSKRADCPPTYRTEEHKRKISLANKGRAGRKWTDGERQARSLSQQGDKNNNYKGRLVRLIHEDGRTYEGYGVNNTIKKLGLGNHLTELLKGQRHIIKGWRLWTE